MEDTATPKVSELSWRSGRRCRPTPTPCMPSQYGSGSGSRISPLSTISRAPTGVGPVELGHRLGMRSASATVLVDRLERAGHVARLPHTRDKRRICLALTPAARHEPLSALAPLTRAVDELASRLSPEQALVTAQFLRDVAETIRIYAREPHHPSREAPRPSSAGKPRDTELQ